MAFKLESHKNTQSPRTSGSGQTQGDRDWPVAPIGIYTAQIMKVEEKLHPFFLKDKKDPSKGNQEMVSFRFKIISDDPKTDGIQVFGDVPNWFSDHPNCRFREWVEQILDIEDGAEIGFEFELEDLQGKLCRISVDHYWSEKKQKDQHKVDAVLSMRNESMAEELF